MQCYGRFDNTEWAGLRSAERACIDNKRARSVQTYIVLFTTSGIMLLLLVTANACSSNINNEHIKNTLTHIHTESADGAVLLRVAVRARFYFSVYSAIATALATTSPRHVKQSAFQYFEIVNLIFRPCIRAVPISKKFKLIHLICCERFLR